MNPNTLRTPKILCVDFDGTIHSYTSGWKGACEIPDPPIEGAIPWLIDLLDDDRFDVQIYSSRSKEPGAVEAMQEWFRAHFASVFKFVLDEDDVPHAANDYVDRLKFPTQKPPAFLTIDDRAFCFEGRYPSRDELDNFLTWQKKPQQSVWLKAYLAMERVVMDTEDTDPNLSEEADELREVVLAPLWARLSNDERWQISTRKKVR